MMAISGLLLFGFLLTHVGGNALLMADDDGESYNAYAAKLKSFGPLLWIARGGLTVLFVGHIYLGLRVSAENRRARGKRSRAPQGSKVQVSSSRSMLLTGLIVLVFLVAHLWHFSFDKRFASQGASLVKETLQGWSALALYAVGIACLWIHLWHALPSAFQTLGVVHPGWSPLLNRVTRLTISLVCGLFLAILSIAFLDG